MKAIFIAILFFPAVVLSSTLHLSDILKRGYHFSQVRYSAFDEPESARGKDTEEYLAMILKSASDEVEKNYVLLREMKVDDKLPHVSSNTATEVFENKINVYDFSKLQGCAKRAITLLKTQVFHKSLKHEELLLQTEAMLAEERGVIDGLQLGIVCGIHMGSFGELAKENAIEELKLTFFIVKESEESVLKLFKILNLLRKSDSFVSIKFLGYLRSSFLVTSYKNKSVQEINLDEVKEQFKKIYLSDSKEILSDGSILEINQSLQRAELDRFFLRVSDEIH